MLNKKIIASTVCNLTDARYFSGWMVDYIHFDLRSETATNLTMQNIGEMQSWIEGPEFIISSDMDVMEKIMVDISARHAMLFDSANDLEWPSFHHINQAFLMNHLNQLKGQRIILSEIDDVDTLEKMVQNYDLEVYIDTKYIKNYYLDAEWLTGYMVHGSPEEKVGFKSYDDIDELFEQLED